MGRFLAVNHRSTEASSGRGGNEAWAAAANVKHLGNITAERDAYCTPAPHGRRRLELIYGGRTALARP